jgi:outer membrane autotransporter protein
MEKDMFKNKCDFKSKFKILKGGKISLVMSAMLIGSIVNVANAEDITISDIKTSEIRYYSNDATNTYTFSNTGGFNIANDVEQYGFYINDADTYTITNDGTFNFVNLNSDAEPGASAIYTRGGGNFYITNNNTINISSSGYGVYGIVNSTNGLGNIMNNGTITAKYEGGYDNRAYAIQSSSTVDVTNSNTGILNGNLDISKTLTNNGKISLPHNATSTNNASVTTFINTGTLEIGLLTDGQTTTHSQLATTNATFDTGSIINVNVLAASTNVDLIKGTILENIVSASNSLTINDLTITDNSALLDFQYVENGETIDLNIVGGTDNNGDAITIESSTQAYGNTNAKAAGKVLQAISNAGNFTAMTPVFTALAGLSTTDAVAKAVETTTPQTAAATVGAASQIANGISGIVEQRQNITMGGGLSSGDEMFANKNAWVKPFGSFGSQDDKDGLNGFDVKAYGIGMGIDGEIKPNQTLGFAFFYTSANVDVNNVSQKSNLDVFTTLVYGNTPIIDEKTKLLYQLGYAWQKTSGERTVFTGDIATSNYTSKTASLDLKLVRDYKMNDNLLLQPIVSATYRHTTTPTYSETGAGPLSLGVKKATATELLVGLGTMGYYKLDNDSRLIGNLHLNYDFKNQQQTTTASYQGASGVTFDTDGIDNGRWSYEAGIGYERDINENSNINFSYSYQAKGTAFSNNTISAKYVLKF